MLNSCWILELAFPQILNGVFICPNLILSAAHVDGLWPLEFAFVQILSGICICPNLVLITDYYNIHLPLEFTFAQILILSTDYGDISWPQFSVQTMVIAAGLNF